MTVAFRPRMTASRQGISVIEGHQRSWQGVLAEVWEADGEVGAGGEYVSDDPRLFILLERAGGHFDLRLAPDRAPIRSRPMIREISYIPPGVPLWTRCDEATHIRHLDLHFDMEALRRRLGDEFSVDYLSTPRLMFSDPKMLNLAALIAAECAQPKSFHELYGDSLTTALLVDFLRLDTRRGERKRSSLSSRQLRRVVDYIEGNCLARIRLEELAELAGLSESHFSHAFKASTGLSPHKWQMNARIRKVKEHLARGDMSLTDIAVATGFFDQAHLTRVFRSHVGETPAAWQRNQPWGG
ncbi:MAG: putative transcriptional regulator [Xanthobacteraceae bacterium]|nr:putative transcriptional regulator [Xanthobacteraceae bacterium]